MTELKGPAGPYQCCSASSGRGGGGEPEEDGKPRGQEVLPEGASAEGAEAGLPAVGGGDAEAEVPLPGERGCPGKPAGVRPGAGRLALRLT